MYARTLKLTLSNGRTRADMEAMADFAYKVYKPEPGFAGATFYVYDEAKGECGSLVLWKTKKEAEAGFDKVKGAFMEKFGGMLASPPDAQIGEVYEPK